MRIQTLATLVLALAACSDDSTSTGSTPPAGTTPAPTGTSNPGSTPAKVRVVHASPDAPAVDVWAEGVNEPLLTNVKFGDTSKYLELPGGTYNVQLRAAPSKASDAVAYSTGPLTVPAGAKITAIAAGLLASKDDASKFRVLPVAEQFTAPGSNQAIVRVVHASADAPAVGIDVGNDDPTKPEVASLARFADTGAAGIPLPAGQALQVGIAAGGARVTAFTTPALPQGGELFVIATGLIGKMPRETDGFALLAVGPNGSIGFIRQNPTVFALHGSPDAPAVDIFAGQAEIAGNLGFGQVSGAIQVPPGEYTLDFFAAAAGTTRPAGNPVTSKPSGKLEAGKRYLAIATGFLAGSPAFQLAAYEDAFVTTDAAKARLRVIHASPDAPAVDVGVVSGATVSPVLVPNLAFPAATAADGLSVDPKTYTLGVTPAGNNSTIVARFDVPATAGARAFIVAAGALDGSKGQSFRLLVLDTSKFPWTVGSLSPKT